MSSPKIPKVSQNPFKGAGKQPRQVVKLIGGRIPSEAPKVPDDVNQRKLRFAFGAIDHGGPWSILNISRDDHSELIRFMAHMEMTEAGIVFQPGGRAKKCPDMSECPNSDALKRLADEYQGLDYLFRLRLDSHKRLYGIRVGNEFHIIWWDPNHEIWPSELKHT